VDHIEFFECPHKKDSIIDPHRFIAQYAYCGSPGKNPTFPLVDRPCGSVERSGHEFSEFVNSLKDFTYLLTRVTGVLLKASRKIGCPIPATSTNAHGQRSERDQVARPGSRVSHT